MTQVTETNADGLRRSFKIVVPATDMEARISAELKDAGKKVRLPGFRPGKVPVSILKRRYGPQITGKVLEEAVQETVQQTLTDRGLRPAIQPKPEITSYEDGKDLEYTFDLEVLPEIGAIDIDDLELTRPTSEVTDEVVQQGLERLAAQRKSYKAPSRARAAKAEDRVTLAFTGKLDGEERAEMSSENQQLVLGSKQFIPGFEDQIVGAKKGEKRAVTVTFPDDYPSEEHRGKEAAFDVEVLDIEGPVETKVDDQMAKDMGLDDLDVLRNAIRERTEAEYGQASRMKVKRELLDKLADRFSFDVPSGMVDAEFDTIWPQVEEALKHAREHADDPDHEHDPDLDRPEDELKAEYRQIAERRVRLGLLLSEIGQRNNIQVTQEELNRGLIAEARRYPGQEQQVIDFFQKNPQAIDSVRAPLFEDKVVDYIVDLAKVTDEPVTPEELLADPDEEPAKEEKPKKAPAKKPAAKKTAAKTSAKTAAASKTAAKKPAAKKATTAKAAAKTAEAVDGDEKPAAAKAGKAAAKKPAAKKAPAKKPTTKAAAAKSPAAKSGDESVDGGA
ncbi:MAG: trigger factor [Pseudomonadota bacterium]